MTVEQVQHLTQRIEQIIGEASPRDSVTIIRAFLREVDIHDVIHWLRERADAATSDAETNWINDVVDNLIPTYSHLWDAIDEEVYQRRDAAATPTWCPEHVPETISETWLRMPEILLTLENRMWLSMLEGGLATLLGPLPWQRLALLDYIQLAMILQALLLWCGISIDREGDVHRRPRGIDADNEWGRLQDIVSLRMLRPYFADPERSAGLGYGFYEDQLAYDQSAYDQSEIPSYHIMDRHGWMAAGHILFMEIYGVSSPAVIWSEDSPSETQLDLTRYVPEIKLELERILHDIERAIPLRGGTLDE